jgi:hypothetical protein
MKKWLILLLTMFVVPSGVFAANNGLSEKQVRAIVKEEAARIRPGKDGAPILSAHIFSTGRVDPTTPGGITQENVRQVDTDGNVVVYCFSGLPPLVGGAGDPRWLANFWSKIDAPHHVAGRPGLQSTSFHSGS